MNNYGITSKNLLHTLPDVLKEDKKLLALATIVADLLAARPEEIDKVRIYPQIENLPESLLDILAYDFKVDWYGYNYSLSVKRAQIKDSFSVHRILGTRGSVERALNDLYPGTEVEEWFDYGGSPYHFRVYLDMTNQQVAIYHDEIIRTIMMFKPIRSHLQDNNIIYRSRANVMIGIESHYTKFNYTLAGTEPDTNTVGVLEDGGLILNTAIDGHTFNYEMAGTGEAGEFPQTNILGSIEEGSLVPEVTAMGSAFDYQLCGEGEREI